MGKNDFFYDFTNDMPANPSEEGSGAQAYKDIEFIEDTPPLIAYLIKDWISHKRYPELVEYATSRIVGQPNVELVLADIYNYLRNISMGIHPNNNVIIAAPSGCGKTETYRVVRDYFKKIIPELPVIQYDMTSMAAEGTKNFDPSEMVSVLLSHPETNGIGIVFIDEFDKKLKKSDINSSIQSQILTTIEGRIFSDGDNKIDTNNTLFIALGAFDFLRRERVNKDYYEAITRTEMIENGAMYELIGRFSSLINYKKLALESVIQIIEKKVCDLSLLLGYDVEISSDTINYLVTMSGTEYGCRMFDSILKDKAMPIYNRLLKTAENESIII